MYDFENIKPNDEVIIKNEIRRVTRVTPTRFYVHYFNATQIWEEAFNKKTGRPVGADTWNTIYAEPVTEDGRKRIENLQLVRNVRSEIEKIVFKGKPVSAVRKLLETLQEFNAIGEES